MGVVKRAVIFGGAPVSMADLPAELPPYVLCVCADAGLRAAQQLGIPPDFVVGDFDSLGSVPAGGNVVTYPAEKDDTDLLLAARYAMAQGCRELVFYGALGGRLDHTIANLQMLRLLADADTAGILIDAGHRVTLQRGGMWNSRQVYRKPKTGKWYLSLFAMTPVCEGITSTGVAYPLDHGTLRASYPLGVSNEILGEQAEISVEKGDLLVVQAKNV